ncbi:hypothetical protein D5b_00128 [Faustovirus]|nr:hypothetical protein D5b_00128 [Faustovirus]AMN84783.1 hypothetical protein D6_00383 [Faustovirus]AMP44085.1 hypothetical protein PRJ_Dakar_00126 [Faustovirus]
MQHNVQHNEQHNVQHNVQHNEPQIVKVDYVYSEIIGRKILAEYFMCLFKRINAGIKWATKMAYYIGSGYVLASFVPLGTFNPPLLRAYRGRIVNFMSAIDAAWVAKYTVYVSIFGVLGRGFVSWCLLPFAQRVYRKYEREAANYINSEN